MATNSDANDSDSCRSGARLILLVLFVRSMVIARSRVPHRACSIGRLIEAWPCLQGKSTKEQGRQHKRTSAGPERRWTKCGEFQMEDERQSCEPDDLYQIWVTVPIVFAKKGHISQGATMGIGSSLDERGGLFVCVRISGSAACRGSMRCAQVALTALLRRKGWRSPLIRRLD